MNMLDIHAFVCVRLMESRHPCIEDTYIYVYKYIYMQILCICTRISMYLSPPCPHARFKHILLIHGCKQGKNTVTHLSLPLCEVALTPCSTSTLQTISSIAASASG